MEITHTHTNIFVYAVLFWTRFEPRPCFKSSPCPGDEKAQETAEVLGRARLEVGKRKRNLLGTTDCGEQNESLL